MKWKEEFPAVVELCEKIGYGRVMQIASDAWARKDPVGALTIGPTRGALAKRLGWKVDGMQDGDDS